MDENDIKQAKELRLKPNPYLLDPNKPYLYQKKGILLMLKRPRMVLGDDVGLGKTLQALVHFTYLKTAYPDMKAVVLTERSALKQWVAEAEGIAPDLKVRIITRGTHPNKIARISAMRQFGGDILVTTYSQMYSYWRYIQEGMGERYTLYADEPNYFKNITSLLHKRVLEFSMGAARAYGLTATVVENRLEEAYGILRVIAPHAIPPKIEFERNFCVQKRIAHGRMVTAGYKNLDQFRKLIEPVFFGRLQDDPEVKQELPEVLTKNIEIELDREQSEKVLEAMDRIISLPSGSVKRVDVLPSMILSQQLVNDPILAGFPKLESAKLEALIETLENSLRGERVIVFSKLRSQIDRIQSALSKKKISVVRVTGAESEEERNTSRTRFMSDGPDRCDVLLITRAGLKALNLQKGGHFIYFDLPWSYGLYRQGVGRIKRTGSQHKKVGVYRFLGALHPDVAKKLGSDQTIDHYTLSVLYKKKKLFNAITGDVTQIEETTGELMEIYKEIKGGAKAKHEVAQGEL